jgi:TolA-binding protein
MRLCWKYALVLLVAVTLVATVSAQADAYADRLLFADGLYARGMHDLALKEYAALLKAFPDGASNDAATFRLAECLRLKGDNATAGRFYSHVVVNFRQSPFRLRAAYRRARLYADEGDHESAVAHFQVILGENPPPDLAAAAQFHLGESLHAKGDADAAYEAFAVILEKHKNSEFHV